MTFTEMWGDLPRNRILDFLGDHPASDYSITEISERTSLSRPTIYTALADLSRLKLVEQTRVLGTSRMFKLNTNNPLVIGVLNHDMEMANDEEVPSSSRKTAAPRRR